MRGQEIQGSLKSSLVVAVAVFVDQGRFLFMDWISVYLNKEYVLGYSDYCILITQTNGI